MGRRIPSFPVRFELFKPTRFSKEESVMYFAHEWDAHQKSLHHDDLLHLPASRSRRDRRRLHPLAQPELIAREYKLANRTSIYRHAHCTSIFAWRRRELGRVLEGMLENHEHIPLEASDAIVRAARVYAHLDENGSWFEPARTNFVFTSPVTALHPLESSLPTNSGRMKRRPKKKPRTAAKSNRNIRFTGKRSSK